MAQNQGSRGRDADRSSSSGKKGASLSGGNFKNDPERAAEAGRKGGENSHGGGRKS